MYLHEQYFLGNKKVGKKLNYSKMERVGFSFSVGCRKIYVE